MATQIIRTGSAVTVEIPEEMLRQANLAVGDPVEWTLTDAGTLALQVPHAEGLLSPDAGYEDWKLAQSESGFAQIDAGQFVEGDRVKDWLRSWGTDHEFPPPR
jgi:antitoxin component of MazEF toxin-antitoxin module